MSHLGLFLSALVDGELDGTERDRVLNHLAGCRSCLREANEMRALKRRLTSLGETSADTAITDRLIHLASDQDSFDHAPRLASSWSYSKFGPAGRRSLQIRQLGKVRSWRTATGMAGTALLAIGFAAFMLGSGQAGPPVPKITPSVDAYRLQHSFDSGQEPATTPGGSATSARVRSAGPGPLKSGQLGSGIVPLSPVRGAPATPMRATPAASPASGSSSQSPGTHTVRRASR